MISASLNPAPPTGNAPATRVTPAVSPSWGLQGGGWRPLALLLPPLLGSPPWIPTGWPWAPHCTFPEGGCGEAEEEEGETRETKGDLCAGVYL